MKFGEMLDWALRLRALGALRAWVGARGPTGGIGAEVAWLAISRGSIVKKHHALSPPDAEVLQQLP